MTKKEWRAKVFMTWYRNGLFPWKTPGHLCGWKYFDFVENLDQETICALEATWSIWQGLA